MKLGSLFDGIGGFPLAGHVCGVETAWMSEIEPYPIAVTKNIFTSAKHLGDISKINGAEIEPVDVITFGSPCQDLSVAGKRAGLKHEANGDDETTRSGLFMEAVRIIKEMRDATNGKYPTFALWENVPGAFSSNRGEDFRIVCEELIKIVEPCAVMPAVPKKGWAYADSYCGDGWSLAYRVFDAQYWGVPQRRRRIHLVLDLRGECAQQVLFEREGVRGYFAPCGAERETAPGYAENCIGTADREGKILNLNKGDVQSKTILDPKGIAPALYAGECRYGGGECYVLDQKIPYTLKIRSGCEGGGKGALIQEDMSATLATNNDQYLFQPTTCIIDTIGGQAERGWQGEIAPTLKASHYKFPPCVTVPVTYDARGNGDGKTANTITGDHENRITDYTSVVVDKEPVYCLQGNGIDRADTAGCNGKGWRENESYTLNTVDRPAVCYRQGGFADYVEGEAGTLKASGGDLGGGSENIVVEQPQYIVRRLTPTECARLQGFPDFWGHFPEKEDFADDEYRFWLDVRNTHAEINGKAVKEYTKKQMLTWYNKLHTDSAEYKMWGNGISLPPAIYCMQGMVEVLNERKRKK